MQMIRRIGYGLMVLFAWVFTASAQDFMPEGLIIYDSDVSGYFQVYSFDLATSDIELLMQDDTLVSYAAVYSPDESQIALSVETNSETFAADVYIMDADGENLQRLTNTPYFTGVPDWSPDGSQIVFNEEDEDFSSDLYIMNANGENRQNLTNTPSASEWEARFSPDGEKIAFSSDADGVNQIYVMDADGSNVISLTSYLETASFSPAWSPDGTQIAFTSGNDVLDVYIMDANGDNLTNLTRFTQGKSAEVPIWSPDGTYLAYTITEDDYASYSIHVMDLSTRETMRLEGTTGTLVLLSDWIAP